MSRYSGRYFKGAAQMVRTDKRSEAEERNEVTPPQKRRECREPKVFRPSVSRS